MGRVQQLLTLVSVPIIVFHCLGLPILSAALESPSIHSLLSFPMSYHLHTIGLQGRVTEVKEGPVTILPMDGWTCVWSGQGSLLLDDGTASIRIEVPGTCAPKEGSLPSEGDHVEIDAFINAEGDAFPVRVTAVASSIKILRTSDNLP